MAKTKKAFDGSEYIPGDPVPDGADKDRWTAIVNRVHGYAADRVVAITGRERELVRIAAGAVASALNKAMGG